MIRGRKLHASGPVCCGAGSVSVAAGERRLPAPARSALCRL